jgi:WD40 repeat protein
MNLLRTLSLIGACVLAVPAAAQQAVPRTDAFGDPLPAAALARMGTVRLRHAAAVDDVRFVADGKWLLSGGQDDTVRLWDLQTGREIHRFAGRAGRLSPDGKTLVTWEAGCHVWDLATGQELSWPLAQLRSLPYNTRAAFTPDGKGIVVAAVAYGTVMAEEGKLKVQTFDLATGKLRSAWIGPSWNGNLNLHVFPAGDVIGVSFGSGWNPENRLELYDAATGKVVARCPFFSKIQHSADGSRFVTEAPQPDNAKHRIYLLVLDSKTGKEQYRYPSGEEMSAALSPDGAKVAFMGRYQSGAAKPLVRIADVATGKLLHELPCSAGSYGSLRFSANGAWLVAAQDNGVLQVWDVASGKLLREVSRRFGGALWAAEVSPDGKLLAAADGNTPLVHVWSLATGKLLPDLYATEFGPSALTWARDGKKLATVTPYGVASVWDTLSGRLTERLPMVATEYGSFPFEMPQLAWVDDGHLHMLGHSYSAWPPGQGAKPEQSIHLVDLTTGKPLRSFGQLGVPIRWWATSADGRTLAAVVGDGIALWDIETGQARGKLPLSERNPKPRKPEDDAAHPIGLAFAPNGKTLAVCALPLGGSPVRYGPLTIRELASGKIRSEHWREDQRDRLTDFWGHDNGFSRILFTPDGKSLAVATHDCVMLWDVSAGREIRRFGAQDLRTASVAFSPDGKLLAAVRYQAGLCLWDVATGTMLRPVTNGRNEVTAFAFTPDGKALATALSDTTVIVWDVKELLSAAAPQALSAKTLEALWQDLASKDAVVAGKALERLQKGGPAAAAFLKDAVQPFPSPDPKLMERLLGELESAKFAVREKAGQALERLGDQALPALRQVLRGNPSLETKLRVMKLVARMEGPTADVRVLQLIRAVEVLEEIGGAEAQAALEALAKGMPGHRVTEAAKDALRRTKGS